MYAITNTLKSFDRAILTMLSMDPIAKDPLTRYTAMISMLFAFLSLIYGCGYIVGFRAMRDTRKGLHWVKVILLYRLYCIISLIT